MATLTIRRLDDAAYERLRNRARANKRSLEAEARDILEAQTQDLDGIVRDLEAFHGEMVAKHGLLPDSTPLIKAMRAAE